MKPQLLSSHMNLWYCKNDHVLAFPALDALYIFFLLKCDWRILGHCSIQAEFIFTAQRFDLSCTGHANSQLLAFRISGRPPFFIWSGTFVGLFTGRVTHLNPQYDNCRI